MSVELDRLKEEVEEIKTVNGSAIALIQGLAERVKAVAGDQAKTLELANELDAQSKALGDAVAANTPAPPA